MRRASDNDCQHTTEGVGQQVVAAPVGHTHLLTLIRERPTYGVLLHTQQRQPAIARGRRRGGGDKRYCKRRRLLKRRQQGQGVCRVSTQGCYPSWPLEASSRQRGFEHHHTIFAGDLHCGKSVSTW